MPRRAVFLDVDGVTASANMVGVIKDAAAFHSRVFGLAGVDPARLHLDRRDIRRDLGRRDRIWSRPSAEKPTETPRLWLALPQGHSTHHHRPARYRQAGARGDDPDGSC